MPVTIFMSLHHLHTTPDVLTNIINILPKLLLHGTVFKDVLSVLYGLLVRLVVFKLPVCDMITRRRWSFIS